MKKHLVAKLSSLAVAFALLVGTSVLAAPVTHAASSSATAGAKTPAPYTTVNVGGGTWNYGTQCCKKVYSQYVHPSLYHSATSICSSNVDKVFANATFWAFSSVTCAIWDSSSVYWDTY